MATQVDAERTLWRADVAGTVVRIAIAAGRVYATAGSMLYALEGASGRRLWRADTGTPGPFRVTGEIVYATGGGHVRALDAATGTERWRYRGAIPSRPAVTGGRVCVIGDSPRWGRTLVVLSERGGAEKWRMEADLRLMSVAADHNLIYVGCADGALLALKARNGRERWRSDAGSWYPDWPERGGGLEVLGTAGGLIYAAGLPYLTPPLGFVAALDGSRGGMRWMTTATFDAGTGRPDEGDPPFSPVPGGVVIGEPGQLTFLESGSGESRACPARLSARFSPPVELDGLICTGTADQQIEAYEASSGRLRWRVRMPGRAQGGPPVPLGLYGSVLVAGGRDHIYAFDPSGLTGEY